MNMLTRRRTGVTVFLLALVLWPGNLYCGDQSAALEKLSQLLRIEKGQTLADVGAGDGEWSVMLARLVGPSGRIYATEVDKGTLRKLKRSVSRAGLDNVITLLGDQQHTGLSEKCCDAILLRLVYHHFAEPGMMNADLLAALKPGGRIAVIDFPPRKNLSRSNIPSNREGHGLQASQIIEEMTASGFELVEQLEHWEKSGDHYLLLFQHSR